MSKHFILHIEDEQFSNTETISQERALDCIYIVRTSQIETEMNDDNTVCSYKKFSNVERAFRSLKGIDLMVRPILHRTEDRVRTHIFLCMRALGTCVGDGSLFIDKLRFSCGNQFTWHDLTLVNFELIDFPRTVSKDSENRP